MVSVTVTTRLGLMLLVTFFNPFTRITVWMWDLAHTLSATIVLPSFDTYRNPRPTQNNGGARSVKRSPKPTRRTIVITLPDRSRNLQNALKTTWKNNGEIWDKTPSNPASKVKALSGLVINSKKDLMQEWRRYFANLLNVPPVTSTADVPPAEVDFPIKTGD